MMRRSGKFWSRSGIALLVVVALFWGVGRWVVPALIVRQLKARFAGNVSIRGWWCGFSSAGVRGLELSELREGRATVWAGAERVTTDLSLGSLLRGRFMPRRIVLEAPSVRLRYDSAGRLLTHMSLDPSSSKPTAIPTISAEDARISLQQEDRPEMVVDRVFARLEPEAGAERLTASTDDPTWGHWEAVGHFDPSFRTGSVQLSGRNVKAEPEKAARIPFVSKEVWKNVVPYGPLDVQLSVELASSGSEAVRIRILLDLRQTTLKLPVLGVAATGTTGEIEIEDNGLVRVKGVAGRAIDGRIETDGTLDFSHPASRFDLALQLERVNVADTPHAWGLHDLDISGRMTGKAHLRVLVNGNDIDFSGSSGHAQITGGSLGGIPVKSLRLGLRAEGKSLQYDTDVPGAAWKNGESFFRVVGQDREPAWAAFWVPLAACPPGLGFRHWRTSHQQWRPNHLRRLGGQWHPEVEHTPTPFASSGGATQALELRQARALGTAWMSGAVLNLIALEPLAAADLPAPAAPEDQAAQARPRFVLPQTISTRLELQDVDIRQVAARAETLGVHLPEIAGRLSLKVRATIPLRTLRDVSAYTFHGDLTLSGASIAGVDVGQFKAHIDLERGVLDLTDFRGMLVDLPNGGAENPPRPTPLVPPRGPLPPGGFRGNLRAQLAPAGRLAASFEGNQLPLGELAGPVLPRPKPLSGLVTVHAEAGVDVAALADPKAWTAQGRIESLRIRSRGATLDAVTARLALAKGRFELSELAARLAGNPLAARLGVDLSAPYAFTGSLAVSGWSLADLMAFVPGTPRPSPLSGELNARADAHGTMSPRSIQTQGRGHIGGFQAGPIPLGDVPFRWTTENDIIVVSDVEARPFGGRVKAEARIPTLGGQTTRGSAAFQGIDTAQLAALAPGGELQLNGKADGRLAFTIPAKPAPGGPALEASLQLSAPDLTVQGLPAEGVQASLGVHKGMLKYEVQANSLGGKVKFRGAVPLGSAAGVRADADANLQAAGVSLGALWNALGVGEPLEELQGLGAINANVRIPLDRGGIYARAVADVRDLRWTRRYALGALRARLALTPRAWWIDSFSGELLGGQASGEARGETPGGRSRRLSFRMSIEQVPLERALQFLPSLARNVDGFATVRLAGRSDEDFRVNGELRVPRATAYNIPLLELHAPVELAVAPDTGQGSLSFHQATVRVGGGTLRSDALFRLGGDRAFRGRVELSALRLGILSRLGGETGRFASGRASGQILFSGFNAGEIRGLRGSVHLRLADAALFELPVFREVSQVLGSARGGLFERGRFDATLGERAMVVDSLSLRGRLVQLHASGTVAYDSRLNLAILISTNQNIPQSGLALMALIPGLGQFALVAGVADAVVPREIALLHVSNYLSNHLLKIRVTGTVRSPSVSVDPTVIVTDAAAGFFANALGLPLDLE